MESTRAAFLTHGARGGLALVAGGSVLAAAAGPALGARSADADIAKLAATAELLAIDFYSKAIASKKLRGEDLEYLAAARAAERAHYKVLAGVLKSDAPKGLAFTYPAGAFGSKMSIAKLGVALETAFVGAYLGAVTALDSNDLKGVAATIAASEASHLSVFGEIATDTPIIPAFPKSLTATQATKAVTPFLVS
jgi:rubrerythrin